VLRKQTVIVRPARMVVLRGTLTIVSLAKWGRTRPVASVVPARASRTLTSRPAPGAAAVARKTSIFANVVVVWIGPWQAIWPGSSGASGALTWAVSEKP
jgi:hypothetical protein